MADSIQFRRGSKTGMPTLAEAEPGWCKDTKELFIGTAGGNEKIGDASVFGRVESLETRATNLETRATNLETSMGNKLTASKAASQADIASNAELADVISAYNTMLAALRAAGIMNT